MVKLLGRGSGKQTFSKRFLLVLEDMFPAACWRNKACATIRTISTSCRLATEYWVLIFMVVLNTEYWILSNRYWVYIYIYITNSPNHILSTYNTQITEHWCTEALSIEYWILDTYFKSCPDLSFSLSMAVVTAAAYHSLISPWWSCKPYHAPQCLCQIGIPGPNIKEYQLSAMRSIHAYNQTSFQEIRKHRKNSCCFCTKNRSERISTMCQFTEVSRRRTLTVSQYWGLKFHTYLSCIESHTSIWVSNSGVSHQMALPPETVKARFFVAIIFLPTSPSSSSLSSCPHCPRPSAMV